MKIYPCLLDNEGKVAAFEVEGAYIGKDGLLQVLSMIPEVSDIRLSRTATDDKDVRAAFIYRGTVGVVMEPFSDSSRLWIGPDERTDTRPNFETIAAAFASFRPSLARAIIGDLLHLRLLLPTVRRPG